MTLLTSLIKLSTYNICTGPYPRPLFLPHVLLFSFPEPHFQNMRVGGDKKRFVIIRQGAIGASHLCPDLSQEFSGRIENKDAARACGENMPFMVNFHPIRQPDPGGN